MEFQMRNWYYFTWLSGDHIVEQHVHFYDVVGWIMGDEPPRHAWGYGGRQVRVEPMWGDIFDHHAVVCEYPTGQRVYGFTRQQNGCYNDVSYFVLGSKGRLTRGKQGWGRFRHPRRAEDAHRTGQSSSGTQHVPRDVRRNRSR